MIDSKKESNPENFVTMAEASKITGIHKTLISNGVELGKVYQHSKLTSPKDRYNRKLIYLPDVRKLARQIKEVRKVTSYK